MSTNISGTSSALLEAIERVAEIAALDDDDIDATLDTELADGTNRDVGDLLYELKSKVDALIG